MIPTNLNDEIVLSAEETYEDDTYKITNENRIAGMLTGLEAVKQRIYIALSVERYQHAIYSWNYGVELADLIGKPVPFVVPELARRITEALVIDPEINAVDDWSFTQSGNSLTADFTVHTVYGDAKIQKEVNV